MAMEQGPGWPSARKQRIINGKAVFDCLRTWSQMRIPVLQGVIRRRILANFRIDAGVMQDLLPSRFRPKLQARYAIAGICLIRLESVRPQGAPALLGLSSENAAHRVAVEWDEAGGGGRDGVFIPRRDTGSLLNSFAGGRLFPGEHHRATFHVEEGPANIDLRMRSRDESLSVRIRGRIGGAFPPTSCFPNLEAASSFFQSGSLGFSVTSRPGRLDAVELRTKSWKVDVLQVDEIFSSYFTDERLFPRGSVEFDCALLMRDVPHEWHSAEEMHL